MPSSGVGFGILRIKRLTSSRCCNWRRERWRHEVPEVAGASVELGAEGLTTWHDGNLLRGGDDSAFDAIRLTHAHGDHSGSALELARSWDLPVYVHPDDLPLAAGKYLPEYGDPIGSCPYLCSWAERSSQDVGGYSGIAATPRMSEPVDAE